MASMLSWRPPKLSTYHDNEFTVPCPSTHTTHLSFHPEQKRMKNLNKATIFSVAVGLIGAAVIVRKLLGRSSSDSKRQSGNITITELWVFPIKGCGGYSPTSVVLTPNGFKFDREWAIIRKDTGAIVTQREQPKIKLISVSLDAGENNLVITAPGQSTLLVPVAESELEGARKQEVTLWVIKGEVADCGPAAAKWFSEYLGFEVFLGRTSALRRPKTSFKHEPVSKETDAVRLQDYSSLHVITEEGLEWVRRESGVTDATSRRFRPNIVCKGVPFPQEDEWENFSVRPRNGSAALRLRTAKHCGRCSVPTINDAGVRDPKAEPTATLRRTREAYYTHQETMSFEGRQPWPMFGLNVFHDDTGIVSVGDRITVESTSSARKVKHVGEARPIV
jgi:uncharacterized protein YcbX